MFSYFSTMHMTCFFDVVLMQVAWLIHLGVMDEPTGTRLQEMRNLNGEMSTNNPSLKSEKRMLISPLIR
jgi:hypothetical protein